MDVSNNREELGRLEVKGGDGGRIKRVRDRERERERVVWTEKIMKY